MPSTEGCGADQSCHVHTSGLFPSCHDICSSAGKQLDGQAMLMCNSAAGASKVPEAAAVCSPDAAISTADAAAVSSTADSSPSTAPPQSTSEAAPLPLPATAAAPHVAKTHTFDSHAAAAELLTQPDATAAGAAPQIVQSAAASASEVVGHEGFKHTDTADSPASFSAPPPPHLPASRPVAPRRIAAFRHSMSALPHRPFMRPDDLGHHHPSGKDHGSFPFRDSNLQQEARTQVMSDSLAEGDGGLAQHRRRGAGVYQRPATAGRATSPSLQEQHHAMQRSRPQTAHPAGQAGLLGR